MSKVFEQNRIALIWDFDKTLISEYMQTPLFKAFNIDPQEFWSEVNAKPIALEKQGHKVNKEIYYLNHILTYIKNGKFPDLNNAKLKEMGKAMQFFPGTLEFFQSIKNEIKSNPDYSAFSIQVEHYIVSTGLAEIIHGSQIAPLVEDVWACEYMEEDDVLSQIIYAIDNTTKTKAVFEINKGVNKHPEHVEVNSLIDEEDRRIPFSNMIYIADGPSDIPAFSVVKKSGGLTFAVYAEDEKSFKQADALRIDGRIHMYGPADYREGTQTNKWLRLQVKKIASTIVEKKKAILKQSGEGIPGHIV